MEKISCKECGKKLDYDWTNLCPDCKRRTNTKRYFSLAITILIIGFLAGLILGGSIPKVTYANSLTYTKSSSDSDFNVAIMLYCWIATGLFDVFIFAVYSVCYRLDLLIDKKNK